MHPTHRTSPGRTRRRRNHHALEAQTLTESPSGFPKQHHRASREDGYVRAGLTIRVPKLRIGHRG